MPKYNNKWQRILLGAGAYIIVLVVLEFFPRLPIDHSQILGFFWVSTITTAVLYSFVPALAGAIVAKINFMLPALLLNTVLWLIAIDILYKIALPAGPVSFLEIAGQNVFGLAFGMVGTVLGAHTGSWFLDKRIQNSANAA